jgi:hypothetical protein
LGSELGPFFPFLRDRDEFGPDDAECEQTNQGKPVNQGFRADFRAELRTEYGQRSKTEAFSRSG